MFAAKTRSINVAHSVWARAAVSSALVLGMAGFAASAQADQRTFSLLPNRTAVPLWNASYSRGTDVFLQSSSANLQFSNGTADVLDDSIRVASQVDLPLNRLTVLLSDNGNRSNVGAFLVVDLGGSLNWQAPQTAAATGGSMSISNMRVDLQNGVVMADLLGQKNAVGPTNNAPVSLTNAVIWLFNPANTSGPTRISPDPLVSADPAAALAADGFTNILNLGKRSSFSPREDFSFNANIAISDLQLTQIGADFMAVSLGLNAMGKEAVDAVNGSQDGWGTLMLKTAFSTVPEPSTYALMGLGLVGVAFASRRKAAHA